VQVIKSWRQRGWDSTTVRVGVAAAAWVGVGASPHERAVALGERSRGCGWERGLWGPPKFSLQRSGGGSVRHERSKGTAASEGQPLPLLAAGGSGYLLSYAVGHGGLKVRVCGCGPYTGTRGRSVSVGEKFFSFLAQTLSKLRFFLLYSPSTLSTSKKNI
jgi:hypothetical protein